MTVFASHCAMMMRNGTLVPKYDLSTKTDVGRQLAERYGGVEWVFTPSQAPWSPGIVDTARESLSKYRGERDVILLIGNPILMCITAIVAADAHDEVTFLQYSRGKYSEVKLTF